MTHREVLHAFVDDLRALLTWLFRQNKRTAKERLLREASWTEADDH